MKLYITKGGGFGMADEVVVVEMTGWTNEEYNSVYDASDEERYDLALAIDKQVRARMPAETLNYIKGIEAGLSYQDAKLYAKGTTNNG